MKTIGLIINPIAGMGGRVGLKGTDGIEILNRAIQLGAFKEAPAVASAALRKLLPLREELTFLTAAGDMGENLCRELGFRFEIVSRPEAAAGAEAGDRVPAGTAEPSDRETAEPTVSEPTTSADTVKAAEIMAGRGTVLILFAGGDGTARDIYRAVGNRAVVLGIPAGVKIYSPVYGNTPQAAGELAFRYLCDSTLPVREEEVVDIDEEAIRNNQVRTELFGYLKVPYKREYLQNRKAPTPLSEEESRNAIALDIVDHMQEGEYYLIGPGTTTGAIMKELNLPNTLLGVDVIKDRALVKQDCNEQDILDLLGEGSGTLILTPTGGQGYLLGRGNQQISAAVLQKIGKENIVVISTNSKIIELRNRPLLIDIGNESMNQKLAGYYRVKVGYGTDLIYRVSAG